MPTKKKYKSEIHELLRNGFIDHFGNVDNVKFLLSPSSIILLGDHTQYNDGILISSAVNSYVGLAYRKVKNSYTIIYDGKVYKGEPGIGFKPSDENAPIKSLINIVNNLIKENHLICGFECYIINQTSKVFGLGNHAAIAMGFLKALVLSSCIKLSNEALLEFAVNSEAEIFGPVVSKPLYYSSLAQRPNTLLYYDSRTDHKKYFPIDKNLRLVVCNTLQEKDNFHQNCKDRILECEVGVKGLRLYIWGIKNLRDVEEKFLQRHIHVLPKRLYTRCLYNIVERKIVEEAYKDLKNNRLNNFGKKLNQTHQKLSELYEISSSAMDKLVLSAEESKVSIGSKMLSCSYHDSTINLVLQKNTNKFASFMDSNFMPVNGSKLQTENYLFSEGVRQLN